MLGTSGSPRRPLIGSPSIFTSRSVRRWARSWARASRLGSAAVAWPSARRIEPTRWASSSTFASAALATRLVSVRRRTNAVRSAGVAALSSAPPSGRSGTTSKVWVRSSGVIRPFRTVAIETVYVPGAAIQPPKLKNPPPPPSSGLVTAWGEGYARSQATRWKPFDAGPVKRRTTWPASSVTVKRICGVSARSSSLSSSQSGRGVSSPASASSFSRSRRSSAGVVHPSFR